MTQVPGEPGDGELRRVKFMHVMKTMFKWAVIGALVIGLLCAAPVIAGMVVTGPLALIPGMGWGQALLGKAAWGVGTKAALIGGLVCGGCGLLSGLSSRDRAAEDYREDAMARGMQAENRQLKMQAMGAGQQQQLAMGYGGAPAAARGRSGAEQGIF